MKKIINVVNFDSKFLTVDGNALYVRFDFGGFYEWYKHTDKTFRLVDVVTSNELERSLDNYESSRKPNVVYLDEISMEN